MLLCCLNIRLLSWLQIFLTDFTLFLICKYYLQIFIWGGFVGRCCVMYVRNPRTGNMKLVQNQCSSLSDANFLCVRIYSIYIKIHYLYCCLCTSWISQDAVPNTQCQQKKIIFTAASLCECASALHIVIYTICLSTNGK